MGEADQIFGSVTTQEVVDAIEMQTSRKLDKKARRASPLLPPAAPALAAAPAAAHHLGLCGRGQL